jgi:hypothetical protein
VSLAPVDVGDIPGAERLPAICTEEHLAHVREIRAAVFDDRGRQHRLDERFEIIARDDGVAGIFHFRQCKALVRTDDHEPSGRPHGALRRRARRFAGQTELEPSHEVAMTGHQPQRRAAIEDDDVARGVY